MKFEKKKMNELEEQNLQTAQKIGKLPVVVLLDSIRSMQNVGSVFRTADVFAINKLHLCGFTAQPPHREIERTALGSTETVDWSFHTSIEEAIQSLKKEDYNIIAIEQTQESIPLHQFKFETEKKYAIILGNEVTGVSQEALNLCDAVIEISQAGNKHSLNISVAAGVVMYKFFEELSALE